MLKAFLKAVYRCDWGSLISQTHWHKITICCQPSGLTCTCFSLKQRKLSLMFYLELNWISIFRGQYNKNTYILKKTRDRKEISRWRLIPSFSITVFSEFKVTGVSWRRLAVFKGRRFGSPCKSPATLRQNNLSHLRTIHISNFTLLWEKAGEPTENMHRLMKKRKSTEGCEAFLWVDSSNETAASRQHQRCSGPSSRNFLWPLFTPPAFRLTSSISSGLMKRLWRLAWQTSVLHPPLLFKVIYFLSHN